MTRRAHLSELWHPVTQRAYLSEATSYDAATIFRPALGSDPDARTADRAYTPLHLAVKFGHVTAGAYTRPLLSST